jgi:phosphonate transport system substrate-binding protein
MRPPHSKPTMQQIKITSCQSPLMDGTCRQIAHFLGDRLGLDVTFEDQIDWPERYQQLDAGEIDMAWICGAPYVRRVARGVALELLVAPVWRGERYGGRPVYFSDVIVRNDSAFQSFADLRGATWVYNEPGSLSGFEVMRYHLATLGLGGDFFGRIMASGAHQRSLELVLAGVADVSAIDSTVLTVLLERKPELAGALRIVAEIGPSPMPPWVVAQSVRPELRRAIREALATMHDDPAGQVILRAGGIARLASVCDADYDPIRTMLRLAALNVPP